MLMQSKTDAPNDICVNLTCNTIGSKDANAGPPADAVAAVKALLIETTRMLPADKSLVPKTHLVEVWGVAALDPDDQIFLWLRDGAPAGITTELIDPGIFPKSNRPADLQPGDLHRKQQLFRNYPGVEENEITDKELAAHLEKGHVMAFDSFAELQ